MRIRARLAGAALATALFLRPSPVDAQRLQGRVIDTGTEAPVGGAALMLFRSDSTVARYGVSDAGGGFTLIPDRPGDYVLRITAVGYQSAELGPLPLGRGETLEITVALGVARTPIDTAAARQLRPRW